MVHFASFQRGIFRPRQMCHGPLSIITVIPRRGRVQRYEDLESEDGSFLYRFQGADPDSRDNRLLRTAWSEQLPLIYFFGVEPALYVPLYPAYIVDFVPAELQCRIVATEAGAGLATSSLLAADPATELTRRYAVGQVKRRVHQAAFRTKVLAAYRHRCAICRLPEARLLDAAHIVPDRDERGRPEVPNGLALCGLHHRVFDANLLGIRPDGTIELAEKLLQATDGPVLEYGLKGFHGKHLQSPRSSAQTPRPEYLRIRYDEFKQVS